MADQQIAFTPVDTGVKETVIDKNSVIRIGIIGCGGIANGKHMPSLRKLPGVEMVAFCDIIPERAEAARAQYGTPDAKVYTDYHELLKDERITVVHVCTPNRSHSFITVDALHAGKHVMCEKPMAINSAEAKKMLDAAHETGKLLSIGYQSRQRVECLYLKKECESGALGDIYFAKALALRRRGVPTWGVFLDEYEQGGGPLIDIGTHALDLTLWLMDNFKPKYCVGTTYHKLNDSVDQGNDCGHWDPEKFKVEDSAFGFIVMENGATVILESSWALNILDNRQATTVLCGTRAGADMDDGLRINGVRHDNLYIDRPSVSPINMQVSGVSSNDPCLLDAAQWIDAVRNGHSACVLPEQAYTITRILEGIYTSAKTGKPFYFD